MDSFTAWVGGKRNLRDKIIARFPLSFTRFVEVFGGAGWVLFGKEPGGFEVYNDFNANLVNLFRVVKQKPEKLIAELDWSLNSRTEFEHIRDLFARKVKMNPVVRAAHFFRLIKMSYGSKCVSFGGQPCDMERGYPSIRAAHRRLGNVVIENRDFEALIRQYDREDAFFYCDPPYFGTEDYYLDVGFTQADHIRLRDALTGLQGKFLLSYNDCPFIRDLYQGFHIEEVTRLNNMAQRFEGGAEYAELFIANYDMSERGRRHEQLSLYL
jgi:DNA adenine methylase